MIANRSRRVHRKIQPVTGKLASWSCAKDLAVIRHKHIIADEETRRISKEDIDATGDIITNAATVMPDIGAARKTTKTIHEQIISKPAKVAAPV